MCFIIISLHVVIRYPSDCCFWFPDWRIVQSFSEIRGGFGEIAVGYEEVGYVSLQIEP